MAFDPDAFIQQSASTATAPAFDPDAFLASQPTYVRRNPQLSAAGYTPEQQAIADQFIAQAQRPALDKVIEGAFGLGEAVAMPFWQAAKGIGQIPAAARNPSQIIPTIGEASRRTGMDIVNLGSVLSQLVGGGENPLNPASKPPAFDLANALLPGLAGVRSVLTGFGNLSSYTPTQEEIAQAVANAPFQEALSQERTNIPSDLTTVEGQLLAGANPTLSEGIAQAVQLAPPLKGAQLITRSLIPTLAKQSIPRIVRTIIKPSEAGMAAKIEASVERQMNDIFHSNPNADKLASTPIEGFTNQVKSSLGDAGTVISDLRSRSGSVLDAGDQLAAKIETRANAVEKSGNKAIADEMRGFAAQKRGAMTDINSLQEGVTIANRKPNILKPKTTAEGFVDEIIAREGGELINKELGAVGPGGEAARKKWSDLKTISDNLEERANKLINNAPPEAQPALLTALNSPQGVAGVFAMVHGWDVAGGLALGSKAVSAWAKKRAKELKDPNAMVTHIYDRLRANPPEKPVPITVTPTVNPLLQVPEGQFLRAQEEAINRQMAQMASPTPSSPVNLTGPVLSPVTSGVRTPFLEVPTSSLPPTAAQFNEYLQRILAEQEAAKVRAAAGSNLGFF